MKPMEWNLLKSRRLKKTRGVSFEEVIGYRLLSVKRHPKRHGQQLMLFEHNGYIWVVPYIEDDKKLFLKTLFPSRKLTKLYKQGEA